MKRFTYIYLFMMAAVCGLLMYFSPDILSGAFLGVMIVLLAAGSIFGILPLISYYTGFSNAIAQIGEVRRTQTAVAWTSISKMDQFFKQRTLDEMFSVYRDKVQVQRSSGQVMADLDEYINEDSLSVHSGQSIIAQIPGTLTGLGLLGTFVGLITGINQIGFSTVDAAISSVENLLGGIQVAFYTSICGVILSILFNTLNKLAWNMMAREYGIFMEMFHQQVIPPVEEQTRYRQRREMTQILERLDRIPRNYGFSSAGGASGGASSTSSGNEQILMPQILSGLKNGEFIFMLQPIYDLNNRHVVGSEALVRWKHPKLGLISPAVFIPVLEKNGYIAKLDQYIWEQVCATLRGWIDEGIRPLPISVNITKTDVMALDIGEFFTSMIGKYHIPPRALEVEFAKNAYLECHSEVFEAEEKLRQSGIRIVVDGFDGNFIPFDGLEHFSADALKLDLRFFNGGNGGSRTDAFSGVAENARRRQLELTAEGIETMEELSSLKKAGVTKGQGYYFSKPLMVDEFRTMAYMEK